MTKGGFRLTIGELDLGLLVGVIGEFIHLKRVWGFGDSARNFRLLSWLESPDYPGLWLGVLWLVC